ncbi:MAG: QueT transporter family protein [Clostridia bacterium]|nr:QueT transporter family protein [Clostridia bacterium]
MNKKLPIKGLVLTGLIAALYVVFTLPFGQIAFGPIQFRIAEILTLLPFFTPWAIPGVTIGCLLSNLLFSTVWDVVFGSLATLIAAYFTYKSNHLLVAPIWPILFNGLIIGTMLTFMILGHFEWLAWLTMMLEVAASEFVICFAIGVPFMRMIRHYKLERLFKIT